MGEGESLRRVLRCLDGGQAKPDSRALREDVEHHQLLGGHDGAAWTDVFALVGAIKVFWLAVPVEALDARMTNLRPLVLRMCQNLFTSPTDDDYRLVRVLLQRLHRFVVLGRRQERLSNREFLELLRAQSQKCALCGYRFSHGDLAAREYFDDPDAAAQIGDLRVPHVDHIVPIYLGGDRKDNLQILCKECNLAKGGALAWPMNRAVLGALLPHELTAMTGGERWLVLARDRQCRRCLRPPSGLDDGTELRVVRRDDTRGWIVENLQAVCDPCLL